MEASSFSWTDLQRLLQQQYILTQSQAEQKTTFEKKLTSSLVTFHTSFIQFVQQADSSSKTGKKKILKDQGFGNAYTFVKEVILTLSKDFRIMAQIVRKKNVEWEQRLQPISLLMVNNLFEDIVEQEINHKDIMYLMTQILQIIIDKQKDISKINFVSDSTSSRILKDFTQRSDIKKYSQMIMKSTLLAISKVQGPIQLDSIQSPVLKSKQAKQQKPSAQLNENPYKQFSRQFTQNWTKKYSLILKQYDKLKGYMKTEQPLCWYVSKHLLYFLGVSDESSLPTFQLFRNETIHKSFIPSTENQVPRRQSSFKSDQLSDNVSILKNIICCFFGEVFKYIYSLPTSIRLICKLIQQIILKQNPGAKREEILLCVSNFLFKTWLLPQLKFHDRALAIGLINDVTTKNVEFVQDIILKIINGDIIVKDRPYKQLINNIVLSLKGSVDNYLEEILKMDLGKVQNLVTKSKQERIRSYSICLNYSQMKTLFQLILETQESISKINSTIVNRTNRIKDMTQNFQLFKGKQDKQDGQYYDGTMAYVLFSELILPKHLQTDYYKNYIQVYKNDKPKNLLRKILVSLDASDVTLLNRQSINKFLQNLERTSKFKQESGKYDKIPMQIKTKYLLSLKIQNYDEIGEQMIQQLISRRPTFEILYNQTKKQFLRASDSVRRYNEKVSEQQVKLHLNNRQQKLNQFIKKVFINRCISSPKSRQNDSSYKTLLARNPNLPEKDKIWSQPQNNCYHAVSNLQFLKNLTGDAKKDDKLSQCHCSDINKYLDVFSKLPEVKSCVVTGQDKVGIRTMFFQFIGYVVSLIKSDYKSNGILLQDENWLTDNLQRMMTKRVYQRIYPRHMTYNDAALYFRLKTLQWILPQHFNINYNIQTDPLWKIAATTLNQIDSFKTPIQKIQCIVGCWQTMNHILQLTSDSKDPANADTTTPLIQYIILKAAPRRLYSNMNFISIFSQTNKMMSGSGYAFTQLQFGINFLQILDQKTLTGVNKLLYQKMIYDKQIEYGIYFLQKRPRAEKQPFDEKKFKDLFKTYLPS